MLYIILQPLSEHILPLIQHINPEEYNDDGDNTTPSTITEEVPLHEHAPGARHCARNFMCISSIPQWPQEVEALLFCLTDEAFRDVKKF